MTPGSHNNEQITSGSLKGFWKAQLGIGLGGVSVFDVGIWGITFVPLSRRIRFQIHLLTKYDEFCKCGSGAKKLPYQVTTGRRMSIAQMDSISYSDNTSRNQAIGVNFSSP